MKTRQDTLTLTAAACIVAGSAIGINAAASPDAMALSATLFTFAMGALLAMLPDLLCPPKPRRKTHGVGSRVYGAPATTTDR